MNDDRTRAEKVGSQLSRRAFIKGAGAAAVVAGIGTIRKPAASAAGSAEVPAVVGRWHSGTAWTRGRDY